MQQLAKVFPITYLRCRYTKYDSSTTARKRLTHVFFGVCLVQLISTFSSSKAIEQLTKFCPQLSSVADTRTITLQQQHKDCLPVSSHACCLFPLSSVFLFSSPISLFLQSSLYIKKWNPERNITSTTTQRLPSHVFPRMLFAPSIFNLPLLLPSLPFSQSSSSYIEQWNAVRNITYNNKKIPFSHVGPCRYFVVRPVLCLPLIALRLPFPRSSSLSPNTSLLFSPAQEDANNYLRGRDTSLPAPTVSYEQGHTRNYVPPAAGRKHLSPAAPPVDGTSE